MTVDAGRPIASPGDAVAIEHDGRRVMLKWHVLRRAPADPPFSVANLRAGLSLNASMEIDLRLLADDAWVCLHDDLLDDETDGTGPVAAIDSEAVRRIRMAGASYAPPLLTEIAEAVRGAVGSGACVQIDLKEPTLSMNDRAVAGFAQLITPIAKNCLLSGTEWAAVQRLGAAVPDLPLGYDPYDLAEGRTFSDADSFEAFMREIDETAPEVQFSYLHHRFVSLALEHGVNPVAFLKARGKKVDVWTLDPTTPDIEAILPAMLTAGADQITTNDPAGMTRLWQDIGPRRR